MRKPETLDTIVTVRRFGTIYDVGNTTIRTLLESMNKIKKEKRNCTPYSLSNWRNGLACTGFELITESDYGYKQARSGDDEVFLEFLTDSKA